MIFPLLLNNGRERHLDHILQTINPDFDFRGHSRLEISWSPINFHDGRVFLDIPLKPGGRLWLVTDPLYLSLQLIALDQNRSAHAHPQIFHFGFMHLDLNLHVVQVR